MCIEVGEEGNKLVDGYLMQKVLVLGETIGLGTAPYEVLAAVINSQNLDWVSRASMSKAKNLQEMEMAWRVKA